MTPGPPTGRLPLALIAGRGRRDVGQGGWPAGHHSRLLSLVSGQGPGRPEPEIEQQRRDQQECEQPDNPEAGGKRRRVAHGNPPTRRVRNIPDPGTRCRGAPPGGGQRRSRKHAREGIIGRSARASRRLEDRNGGVACQPGGAAAVTGASGVLGQLSGVEQRFCKLEELAPQALVQNRPREVLNHRSRTCQGGELRFAPRLAAMQPGQ